MMIKKQTKLKQHQLLVAPREVADKEKPLTIIFDCGGVLIDVSRGAVLGALGYFALTLRFFMGGSLRTMKNDMFEHVRRLKPEPVCKDTLYDDQGVPLPPLIAEWLLGLRPLNEMHDDIQKRIAADDYLQNHLVERILLQRFMRYMFTTKTFASAVRLKPLMVEFLQACAQEGHDIYLLSNFNHELFDEIAQLHPDLFKNVKGQFVSGVVKNAKPNLAFFQQFLNEHDIDASKKTCVFIDDQLENLESMQMVAEGMICVPPQAIVKVQTGDNKHEFHIDLDLKHSKKEG